MSIKKMTPLTRTTHCTPSLAHTQTHQKHLNKKCAKWDQIGVVLLGFPSSVTATVSVSYKSCCQSGSERSSNPMEQHQNETKKKEKKTHTHTKRGGIN